MTHAPPDTSPHLGEMVRMNSVPHSAINESLGSPELAGTVAKLGVETKISSPDAFAAFLAAERERWSAVVKAAGVRVE